MRVDLPSSTEPAVSRRSRDILQWKVSVRHFRRTRYRSCRYNLPCSYMVYAAAKIMQKGEGAKQTGWFFRFGTLLIPVFVESGDEQCRNV